MIQRRDGEELGREGRVQEPESDLKTAPPFIMANQQPSILYIISHKADRLNDVQTCSRLYKTHNLGTQKKVTRKVKRSS